MKIVREEKTFEEGRQMQFEVMMERLASMQAKYQGVRGELLSKVWNELMQLKPTSQAVPPRSEGSAARPLASVAEFLPTCRMCGRGMKRNGTDNTLVCERGHTRVV